MRTIDTGIGMFKPICTNWVLEHEEQTHNMFNDCFRYVLLWKSEGRSDIVNSFTNLCLNSHLEQEVLSCLVHLTLSGNTGPEGAVKIVHHFACIHKGSH